MSRPNCPPLLAVLLSLVLIGCTSTSDPCPCGGASPTPRPDAEAETAALWLSGDVVAPQALYELIRTDLAAIRNKYRDTAPVAIEFAAPWAVSEVVAFLTNDAFNRLREGTFTEFDELGELFEVTEVDTTQAPVPGGRLVHLIFAGRRNPQRMSEAYAAVDGVEAAEPNYVVGDRSNVYPWTLGTTRTYLFRDASGDCPAGCIHNAFHYFRLRDLPTIEYVGSYDPSIDPEPEWWAEAAAAYEAYRGF